MNSLSARCILLLDYVIDNAGITYRYCTVGGRHIDRSVWPNASRCQAFVNVVVNWVLYTVWHSLMQGFSTGLSPLLLFISIFCVYWRSYGSVGCLLKVCTVVNQYYARGYEQRVQTKLYVVLKQTTSVAEVVCLCQGSCTMYQRQTLAF